MARLLERLNALQVRRLGEGLHPDGGGLYLQVTGEAGRSWIFRYWIDGRERQMGLGAVHTISLAEARVAAREARRQRAEGLDPIEERRKAEVAEKLEEAKGITFAGAVAAYLAANDVAWKNAKHRKQWKTTLETYAEPFMGKLSVGDVNTDHVLQALQPIWLKKTETASRVRGRIETVLDWATALGHRTGDNPARWKGHLDQVLPAKSKVAKVQHHEALPFVEISAFVKRLDAIKRVPARALLFIILTAARCGEVLGAEWEEFDLAKKIWTVPAERMKGAKEHRVTLSAPAIALLEDMRARWIQNQAGRAKGKASAASPMTPTGPVFVREGAIKPVSETSLRKVMALVGGDEVTIHGFRSTFRDWAAETTDYAREVVEMALAHAIDDKVEAAYRRGDLLEKRRALMDDWSKACAVAT